MNFKVSIRYKTAALVLTSTLIVVAVCMCLEYFLAFHMLKSTIGRDHAKIADILASNVAQRINEEVDYLRGAIAYNNEYKKVLRERNRQYQNLDPAGVQKFMADMDRQWANAGTDSPLVAGYLETKVSQELKEVRIADRENSEIFLSDRFGGLVATTGKTSDFYQADEGWWQSAFASDKGEIFVGNLEFDESDGIFGLTFALPVLDDDGSVLGVVKAVLDVRLLFSFLSEFKADNSSHLSLVDENGRVIFHENIVPLSRTLFSDKEFQRITQSPTHQGITVVSGVHPEKVFNVFAKVDSPFLLKQGVAWRVFLAQDEKEAFAPLYTLLFQSLVVTGALILTLLPLGVILGGMLIKPIQKLRDATAQIAKGHLDYKIDITTGDEFETLAHSFEDMAQKIMSEKDYSGSVVAALETLSSNLERQVLDRTESLSRMQRATMNIMEDLHASKVALEKSKDSFLNIVVKSADGIVVVDHDGMIRFANPAAAHMLKTEKEKLLGTDFGIQIQEDKANEIGIVRDNGQAGVGALSSSPTHWDGDAAYLIIIHDITQSKQAEAAVKESGEYFRAIFDTATDGILVADLATKKFSMGNRAICQQLGYSPEEIKKLGIMDIHPENDLPRIVDQFESQAKGEFSLAENIPVKRKDGTLFFADINTNIVFHGGKKFLFGFFHDVTARKQAEENDKANIRFLENLGRVDLAIKQETDVEKMLQDVVEVVFSIFDCDRAWLLYPCDPLAPSFRVPVEVSRPEYPGAHIRALDVAMTPDVALNLREALETAEPVAYVVGTARPVNTISAEQFGVQSQLFTALYPKLGRPWVFGLHQCSHPRIWTAEEKKLFKEIGRRISDGLSEALFLRELQESNAKLKNLDKLKSEFISTVSHELRTPLAIIKEGVSLVMEEAAGTVTPDQAVLLGMSKDNVDRLANIINDLLDMSKIEAGKVIIRRTRVNMSQLLNEVCTHWNITAAKNNQTCNLSVPGHVVDADVDVGKVTQVLNNLISNALKFTQDGKVAVELEDRGDVIAISVANVGVGFTQEELPLVFEKFQQFNRPIGTGTHGTGLGLAISKNLVELHGGEIRVDSEPGKVTRITVTLPKVSEV